MSKYANALGIWEIRLNGNEIDVKPTLNDIRKYKRILFDNMKDKTLLFEKFEDFMINMIQRDNPSDEKNDIEQFVVLNTIDLFKESQIAFKFTTREQIEKAEKESMGDIKKLIGEN